MLRRIGRGYDEQEIVFAYVGQNLVSGIIDFVCGILVLEADYIYRWCS